VATNVGQVKAEFVGDSSKLVAAANQATAAVSKFATASADSATKAGQSAVKTAQAVQKVSQETKQSLSKVEQAYEKASYGTNEFSLAYHEMARKVAADSKKIEHASESAARVGNKFTDMGGKMTAVGSKMSMALTAPMLLAGGQAIKTANDFEFSMQSIVAMVGLSEDKVAEMGIAAREMAKEYGGSATQAADALYFVASAGIDGATAMQVLEQSLKATAIGMGDTSIIADTVSSALNAYGIENLSAAQATDLMVAAVREGKMEADALAGALPRVLPIASAMGVSFNEVGAAFAAMSRNGTDANEAATQLRAIMSSLLQPTKEAEETMAGFGLSAEGLRQQIKDKGLLSTLQTLTTAFGNNDAAQAAVFGNVRALTGIMSMFGEATASTTKIFENLTDNTGDADRAFAAMAQTGAFKMKQVMAEMKDAFISLGQVLIPMVVPALKFLATAFEKVMTTINSMPNFVKTIIVVFGGLVAVAGPLLIMLGSLSKAWLALKAAMQAPAFASAIAQFAAAGPIIAGVAIAVVAVAAAWYAFAQDAKEAKERQERLTEAFKSAGEPTAVLHDQVKGLVDEYVKLQNALPATANAADNVATAFATAESVTLGINDEISTLGLTMEEVGAAVSTGTDAFDGLGDVLLGLSYDQLILTGDAAIGVQDALLTAANAGTPFASAMLEAVKAGEMTGNQVKDLLYDLHDLSNAFDDNREALDDENKKLLQSADTALYFSSILGSDVYNAILGSGAAMAEAAGRTDVYTFTLQALQQRTESVTAAQNAFLGGLAGVFPEAVTTAGVRVQELSSIYGELASETDKGTVSQDKFLAKLGLLDEMLANELVLTTQDAIDKNEKLAESFKGSGDSSLDLSNAYREQAKQITDLLLKTAQYGGNNKQAMETVALMVIRLGDAARAAGYTDDEVRNLIGAMGLLDGIEAKFGINFAINTADLDKQIANVEAAIGNMLWAAGAATGDTTARLSKTLADLKSIKAAIGVTSTSGGGGGGGGGGGASKPDNPFAWVEGWLKDTKSFADAIMSVDWAEGLVGASPKEIGKAITDLLEEAVRLGIRDLPQTKTYFDQIAAQGTQLANLATARDELAKKFEASSKALENAINARKSFVSSTEDALSGLGQFNLDKITGETAKNLGEIGQLDVTQFSPEKIKAKLRESIDKIKNFKSVVKGLADAGFPPYFIEQVIAAGPIDGTVMGQVLLDSSSFQDIEDYKNLVKELTTQTQTTGAMFGDLVFGTQIADLTSANDILRTALTDANETIKDLIAAIVANTQNAVSTVNPAVPSTTGAAPAASPAPAAPAIPAGTDFAGLGRMMDAAIARLVPGQQTNWNDGPLSNGGAIINGIYLPPGLDFSGFHAKGGIATKASLGVIGEAGPEAIIPLSRMGEFGGGTTTNNIVINMPAGSDGKDVVAAIQDYNRRYGPAPFNTRAF
jgi:TP901 family phage tail tape measure protein